MVMVIMMPPPVMMATVSATLFMSPSIMTTPIMSTTCEHKVRRSKQKQRHKKQTNDLFHSKILLRIFSYIVHQKLCKVNTFLYANNMLGMGYANAGHGAYFKDFNPSRERGAHWYCAGSGIGRYRASCRPCA